MNRFISFLTLVALALSTNFLPLRSASAAGESCQDYHIIFARGSGSSLGAEEYTKFKSALSQYLGPFAHAEYSFTFGFYELGSSRQGGYRYPAADASHFGTMLGARISGGEAFKYGRSVTQGVNELVAHIKSYSAACPNASFILGGYSQGAQVISTALPKLDSRKVLYATTFGDPKLYLPEGRVLEGQWQSLSCISPKNNSEYRVNVMDCSVEVGILGGTIPYQPSGYSGRLGTWCFMDDFMCGSSIDWFHLLEAHTSYAASGEFSAASAIILQKIADDRDDLVCFKFNNRLTCKARSAGSGNDSASTSAVSALSLSPDPAVSALSDEDFSDIDADPPVRDQTLRLHLEKEVAGDRFAVIVDGALLGFTEETDLEITDLSADSTVQIVPVSAAGTRRDAQTFSAPSSFSAPNGNSDSVSNNASPTPEHTTPKAPNTGRR